MLLLPSDYLDWPEDTTGLLGRVRRELRQLILAGPPPLWPPLAGRTDVERESLRFVVESFVLKLMRFLQIAFATLLSDGEYRSHCFLLRRFTRLGASNLRGKCQPGSVD